jgi:hypothetical protein
MSYTPPPPPPPGTGGYAMPQTNQKALWSMILGILSLVCCGLLAGIPALILGNTAQKEIAAAGGAQSGEGMAKAGVILGWISIALSVLGLIFALTTGALSNGGF